MKRISDLHRARNTTTRNNRDQYASHRERVMQILTSSAVSPTDRVCILGAGNGNDIDLGQLVSQFAQVHLVDLDADALEFAEGKVASSDGVSTQGGVDLTGILNQLEQISKPESVDDAVIDQLIQTSRESQVQIASGPFQVVASTCILTQLIDSLVKVVGQHPRLIELTMEIRRRHLELMLDSIMAAGLGILITDFVATTTLPELMSIPGEQFQNAMTQALIAGNFFTGANPLAIRKLLTEDLAYSSRLAEVELLPPWRWDIGPKQFAVAGIRFRKS